MKLYSYWRSSASYRVRICLNVKGLDWESEAIHLVQDGGQQHSEKFLKVNPSGLVPAFVDKDITLNQSLAIMEYLEELYPKPPLLPVDVRQRAGVRALCYDIACDSAPLNNLRVRQYLKNELDVTPEKEKAFLFHWLALTFSALETRAKSSDFLSGDFLWGNQVTMADTVLIPQIYNAIRLNYDMSQHPKLDQVWQHCNTLDAFIDALPENQADAD
ncbi:MAG: maleylacetoacetate isomerase [Candidatus Azotimanducaceae bacterium]|jgi:maleylacetoacetate isomerase